MRDIRQKSYILTLNECSGTIDRLATPEEFPEVNFVHKDEVSAFGSLSLSPRGVPWKLADTGSPIGVRSYVFREERRFCRFEQQEGNRLRCRNPATGHTLDYELAPDFFSLRWRGELPDADQIAVDLNAAFLDLRQNERRENQFTLQSFYASGERDLGCVYLARCGVMDEAQSSASHLLR